MKTFLLPLLSFLLYTQLTVAQSLQLLLGSTFHDAVWDSEFGDLEDVGSPDEGGQLYLFLENSTGQDLTIDSVHVQNLNGVNQIFDGWYNWPDTLLASNQNISTLFVKGINAPLAEGSDARIVVFTSDNASTTFDLSDLTTPKLRIANYVPSYDRNALWVYLRNDGSTIVQLESLLLNGLEVSLQATGQLVTLYGNSTIQPNETRMINIQTGLDLSDLTSYALRVKYNTDKWVSSSVRIVAPYFPIGSWHSSGMNPETEYGRKRMRKVGVQSLHGPGNYQFIQDANSEYHIQVIREPSFGTPFDVANAAPELIANANNPNLLAWTVDDEPDLNGKPIDEQLLKAKAYRDNDFDTPTHVNLAVQKKYQRYGWYTDIVSMDHYAAPSAPNIIPLTNIPLIGRMSEIEEAYAYSHQLKLNTEPRRMWSWVQFAAGVWDVQPEPSAVNYQFWAHISAGAKGMEYFVAQSETADDYPEIWAEGESLFAEFKQIRNACLYGEPSAIATSSNQDVLTYALVGPEAIVVFALNNSMEFTGNQLTGFATEVNPQNYSITVDVPAWFYHDESYRVTPLGKAEDFSTSTVGNTVTITPNGTLYDRMHVFVLTSADMEAPKPLDGLNVADYVDSANYTLSWKESFDNIGTQGYKIHFNNVLVGDVAAPIFEADSQSIACSGYYRVTPYDNSGNFGVADSVEFILSGISPTITTQPTDTLIYLGDNLQLSIEASGVVGYQWQVFDGTSWIDLVNSSQINGANSSVLNMTYEAVFAFLDASYRCLILDPCGGQLISDEAMVNITDNINEFTTEPLLAYPNPTSGNIQIQFPNGDKGGLLSAYDNQGKRILETRISANQTRFDLNLESVENGIYLLRYANADGKVFTHRAILQR